MATKGSMGRPIKYQAYSALAYKKGSDTPMVVTKKANSKAAFIKELRDDGYKVEYNHIKLKAVFDYIVNQSPATPNDWMCITRVWTDKDGNIVSNYEENYKKLVKKNKKMLAAITD